MFFVFFNQNSSKLSMNTSEAMVKRQCASKGQPNTESRIKNGFGSEYCFRSLMSFIVILHNNFY
jgi:hypothetical protein